MKLLGEGEGVSEGGWSILGAGREGGKVRNLEAPTRTGQGCQVRI